jgi:hypothetical protein
MPAIHFAWDPKLVDGRRRTCPKARWDKAARAWMMTTVEAETFLAASHERLQSGRTKSQIAIDDEQLIAGLVRGASIKIKKAD